MVSTGGTPEGQALSAYPVSNQNFPSNPETVRSSWDDSFARGFQSSESRPSYQCCDSSHTFAAGAITLIGVPTAPTTSGRVLRTGPEELDGLSSVADVVPPFRGPHSGMHFTVGVEEASALDAVVDRRAAVAAPCTVRKLNPRQAARSYSCNSPPRRSRRLNASGCEPVHVSVAGRPFGGTRSKLR